MVLVTTTFFVVFQILWSLEAAVLKKLYPPEGKNSHGGRIALL